MTTGDPAGFPTDGGLWSSGAFRSDHIGVRRLFLLSFLISLAGTSHVLAQGWQGFATAGSGSIDYGRGNRQSIAQFSGGALFTIGKGPLAVGGQGDLLVSHGYPGGRGGFLAEVSPIRSGRVRPFGNGGYFFADGGPSRTIHEPSFQFGVGRR